MITDRFRHCLFLKCKCLYKLTKREGNRWCVVGVFIEQPLRVSSLSRVGAEGLSLLRHALTFRWVKAFWSCYENPGPCCFLILVISLTTINCCLKLNLPLSLSDSTSWRYQSLRVFPSHTITDDEDFVFNSPLLSRFQSLFVQFVTRNCLQASNRWTALPKTPFWLGVKWYKIPGWQGGEGGVYTWLISKCL